jgi:phage terminase large subunit
MESYVGDKKLYMKELLYVNNHTHQQLVSLIVTDFKSVIGKRPIIVDSAVPELIKELKRAGFNATPAEKGPDSVYKGILLVKQFNLFATKDSPNHMRELQSYIWKGDREGNLIDEPVKIDDDACDAFRYPVQTYGKRHWIKSEHTHFTPRRETRRNNFLTGF